MLLSQSIHFCQRQALKEMRGLQASTSAAPQRFRQSQLRLTEALRGRRQHRRPRLAAEARSMIAVLMGDGSEAVSIWGEADGQASSC